MTEKERLKVIKKTITVLKSGGVILYPTDTIWGIGCDSTNIAAIEKIYRIKERTLTKSLILLIHDISLLKQHIKHIPSPALDIINTENTPTTIIYNNPINLPNLLIQNDTIAIRITKHPVLKMMLSKFNKAITSTSANISGQELATSLDKIDAKIKQKVDYIIPEDFIDLKNGSTASRILKINKNNTIEIIRK